MPRQESRGHEEEDHHGGEGGDGALGVEAGGDDIHEQAADGVPARPSIQAVGLDPLGVEDGDAARPSPG